VFVDLYGARMVTSPSRVRKPRRRSVRTGLGTLLALALLATAACSGSGSSPGGGDGNDGADGGDTPPSVELFTGTDEEFYVPPDPLPQGEPGDLIRVMEVTEAGGVATGKIMYHSRDAQDRDRPVTALVTYPTTEAPEGGWPVVSTAPGTVGIAAHCGISHIASDAPAWGIEGVRVMTDYIGLGAVGGPPHPYLSRPSEGHSVIDAVRAVRQLPDAHAGDRWLSVGHSQGGHGALSAHELADEYAPELDHVATLAIAPAALLDEVYGGIDPIVTGVLTAMALYGGAGEHPEVDVDDYASPGLAAASDVLETGCLAEITDDLVGVALGGGLFTADPRTTEPARSVLLQNEVGTVAVDAPLFLVSGTADDRVVIDRVRDFYARLCAVGQVTELLIVDGAGHDSIVPDTASQTSAWLQARLDGEEPTDSCAESPTATP
jgi:pimeloyl-ACP methyl ester carboxylesterase